jgi:virginiamycin B lyase
MRSLIVAGSAVAVVGTAAAAPTLQEFRLPRNAQPEGIALGHDGNVWFTEFGGKIGRITPSTGAIARFPGGRAGTRSGPAYITAGPNNSMFFTVHDGVLGRITMNGSISYINLPRRGQSNYRGITSHRGRLWVVDHGGDDDGERILSVSPGGNVRQYPVDNRANPENITVGPDGALWFTHAGGDPSLGRIAAGARSGAKPKRFSMGGATNPYGIVTGPDGALWFTEPNGNAVSRFAPGQGLTRYELPSANSQPQNIAVGADGALWFTQGRGARLGRITVDGDVTQFRVRPRSNPFGIAALPDGTVWYTQFQRVTGDRVGRLIPEAPPAPPPAPEPAPPAPVEPVPPPAEPPPVV